MTNEYTDYEPYLHRRHLTPEELDAIAALSGVEASDLATGYPTGNCEPWECEFAVLLWNLCQHYTPTQQKRAPHPLPDVDTHALLLSDLMHFLSKQTSPNMSTQVIAVMAVRTLVEASAGSTRFETERFKQRWAKLLDEAEKHFHSMLPQG